MNLAAVDQIARAVLYEGYMLYPYRPSSVKNQQRWNFGVLYPFSYSEAQAGSDPWSMQTECLVEGNSETTIEIRIRFLQLVARSIGEVTLPVGELGPAETPEYRLVPRLVVNGRLYQPWQEAVEREVIFRVCVQDSSSKHVPDAFSFPAEKHLEYLRGSDGQAAGVIVRESRTICGALEVMRETVKEGVFKLSARILNTTPFVFNPEQSSREDVLLSSLVSAHTVLGVRDGRFCSLLEPSESLREIAATCQNVGTWPVLVGNGGDCDTLLSSPIILYDYPQIAPESAGDLFDGTEIDEILSLRIMTLTDEEKREMRESDERARQLLERTETLPAEQLMKLHGVLRNLRSVPAPESDYLAQHPLELEHLASHPLLEEPR